MLYLTRAIGAMATATSDDTTRNALTGVHVQATDAGVTMTASDARILVRLESGPAIDPKEYPAIPGLSEAPNGATSAILPADTCVELGKTLKGRKRALPCEEIAGVQLSEKAITIGTCKDLRPSLTTVRPVEGSFPDADAVLRCDVPKVSVVLSIPLLQKLLKTCAGLVAERQEYLRFDIFSDTKQTKEGGMNSEAIRIVGQGANGGRITALMMPMTTDVAFDSRYPDAGKPARDRIAREAAEEEARLAKEGNTNGTH